jgi:hypothetical protein
MGRREAVKSQHSLTAAGKMEGGGAAHRPETGNNRVVAGWHHAMIAGGVKSGQRNAMRDA